MDDYDLSMANEQIDRDAKHALIDNHVGARMRLRRTLMGMSQERLGEALGLTFQQVQKYERGVNRVSASRLYDLARVLDVPISFFFDDLPAAVAARVGRLPGFSPQRAVGFAEQQEGFDTAPQTASDTSLNRRETLELVRAYYRIPDAAVRKRMFELIKSMGAESL
jgi:transcriptional regulator with XRE-family HTH domain